MSNLSHSGRMLGIITMRLEGRTLEEIGSEYGITRERVRQLLKPYNVPNPDLKFKKTCAVCGQIFTYKQSQGKTCSRECTRANLRRNSPARKSELAYYLRFVTEARWSDIADWLNIGQGASDLSKSMMSVNTAKVYARTHQRSWPIPSVRNDPISSDEVESLIEEMRASDRYLTESELLELKTSFLLRRIGQ